MKQDPRNYLAFALDVPTLDEAVSYINLLSEYVWTFKVGLELFTACGPQVFDFIRKVDANIFLDLKLCDIPETVARAVVAANEHEVDYLTIHSLGGKQMLAMAQKNTSNTKLLAITLLTSLGQDDLSDLCMTNGASPREIVGSLSDLAYKQGIRGFVCSPHEASVIKESHPETFVVTPGVRPSLLDFGDQARTTTPSTAIRAGSDLLVVGRPIRDARDPMKATWAILDEIALSLELK